MKKRALAIFLTVLIPSLAYAACTAGDPSPCCPWSDKLPVQVGGMADRAQLDRWMALAADGDRASIDPLFHALPRTARRTHS